jgi:hypothetical protein
MMREIDQQTANEIVVGLERITLSSNNRGAVTAKPFGLLTINNNSNQNNTVISSKVASSSDIGVKSCSTNGLSLSCETDFDGKVDFTFTSSDEENPVLVFKLELIDSESNIYRYGLNNIMKIIQVNECIENCSITVSFEQYYKIGDWSNVFKFVISDNNTSEEFNVVVSKQDGCSRLEKVVSIQGYTKFVPIVFDSNRFEVGFKSVFGYAELRQSFAKCLLL